MKSTFDGDGSADERARRRLGWWGKAPQWVRAFAVAAAVAALLLVVMLLSGHGPGRHMGHGLGELGRQAWW